MPKKVDFPQQKLEGFVGGICLFFFAVLLFIFFLIYLSRETFFWDTFRQNLTQMYQWFGCHIGIMLLALFFLPTFGLPISPFWVLAGTLWNFKISATLCFLGIGFNLVFSYFFYRKCLNRLLIKLIFRKKSPPRIVFPSRLNSLRLVFLIQLIPHMPYVAQCYILSTMPEVNFWHYLSLSWIFQFIWASGFILSGEAIKFGQWGLTTFFLILLGTYLTYRGYLYYKTQKFS